MTEKFNENFSIKYGGIMRYEIYFKDKLIHVELDYNLALKWLLDNNHITKSTYQNNYRRGIIS